MKFIGNIIIISILLTYGAISDETTCNTHDKLSKEYAKCNSELIKKKSIKIKDKASNKLKDTKKKFDGSKLKKKLLKFKKSKSHKEYKEN